MYKTIFLQIIILLTLNAKNLYMTSFFAKKNLE